VDKLSGRKQCGHGRTVLSGTAQPQSVHSVLQPPPRPYSTCVALHRIKALCPAYTRSEAALHKSIARRHLTCASSLPRQVDPAENLGYLVCSAPPCNYKRALPRVAAMPVRILSRPAEAALYLKADGKHGRGASISTKLLDLERRQARRFGLRVLMSVIIMYCNRKINIQFFPSIHNKK